MAKLMKPEFDLSPKGIVAFCPDLPVSLRQDLLNQLELAWDESEDFEVEIWVPVWEEPYGYFLRVKVCLFDARFTIERSLS